MAEAPGIELAKAYVSVIPSMQGSRAIIGRELGTAAAVEGERAGRTLGQRMRSGFGNSIRGFASFIGQTAKAGMLAGGAAVTAAGFIGVKTAAEMETARISFETMLGSGKKAEGFLSKLAAFAAKTPFDLPGLQKSAQSLISIGIDSKKIIPIMTTLGNVTSGMGTGAEGIQRATIALQQMNAAGRITAEDLNQLRDAGIPVFDLLTAATGKTKAEIAGMAQSGELGRKELEQLMAALETGKGFERFNGMMDKQSQSLSGLWATLKDTFSVGMAEAIEPAIPILKDGLGGAIEFTAAAAPKLAAGFAQIINGGQALYDLLIRGDFTGKFRDVFHVEEDSKLVDYLFRIREFFIGLGQATSRLDFTSIQGFFVSLGPAGREVGESFGIIWTSLQELMPAFQAFGEQLPAFARGGLGLVAKGLAFLADHVDTIIAWMPALVAAFVAWRVIRVALNAAEAASVPIMLAANIARIAAARAEYQLAVAQRTNMAAGIQSNAVQQVGMFTRLRHAAATTAQAAATTAAATAARVAAAAQWLLNAALSANPIGIVVLALAGLVAAGVAAYQNIGWFKDGVNTAFAAIGGVATWLYANAVKPAFDGIGAAIRWVAGIFQWWWQNIVSPVMGFIGGAINAWWMLTSGIFALAVAFVQKVLGPVFLWLWNSIVAPVFGWIGSKIGAFWTGARIIFEAVGGYLRATFGPQIKWLQTSVFDPVFGTIGRIVSNAWTKTIRPIFSTLIGWATKNIPDAFDDAVRFVSAAWSGIVEAVKSPIRFVVEKVINGGIIGTFNKIADFLEVKRLPDVAVPGWLRASTPYKAGNTGRGATRGANAFATGGVVPGYEPAKRDNMLAWLRNGEGVLVPEVVRALGPGFVDAVNHAGNTGGVSAVRALAGIGSPNKPEGKIIHPMGGSFVISSPYAPRPDVGFHDGLDFAAPTGTPVRAPAAGSIVYAGWGSGGAGNMVQMNHGGGLTSLFYHLSKVFARTGSTVAAGKLIGAVGSTGNSTGPHLHFTTRKNGQHFNPALFLSGAMGAGTGGGGTGPAFINPFEAMANFAADQFRKMFPGGGAFVDLGIGLGRKLIGDLGEFVGGKIGIGGMVPELFDTGGTLTPGDHLVRNATGQNEQVLNPWQMDLVESALAAKAGGDVYNLYGIPMDNTEAVAREIMREKKRHDRGGVFAGIRK